MSSKKQNLLALHAVVFAGPNGPGKTSLINAIKANGLKTVNGLYPIPDQFINPDQVAKDLKGYFLDQESRDIAATKAAVVMRSDATQSKRPFAFETVMSHPSRINELLLLKEQNYHVLLTFITTDDPEKNVARVKMRYETGTTTGHFVPAEKVRSRYLRTLALLPRAAEIADAVFVYDNSAEFKKPELQALIEKNVSFSVSPNAKDWVRDYLIYPLQQRERERTEIAKEISKDGLEIVSVNELGGIYEGPVLLKSHFYIAHLNSSTRQVVIHDRLLLDTIHETLNVPSDSYAINETLKISYSIKNAPSVQRLQVKVLIQPNGIDEKPAA